MMDNMALFGTEDLNKVMELYQEWTSYEYQEKLSERKNVRNRLVYEYEKENL